MSNEEEKRCPLCAEEMDWTDLQFKPCQCGYQVCVWCWNHIIDMADKDATEGRCPACRTPYDKEKIVAMEANCERVAINSNRKQKASKAKPKTNEVKKDLNNVRVIQRKMAYVIGLPLSLADENLLQQKEYFAQYGKVTKISLSRTAGGAIQQFVNDTCSVYITYSKEEEAIRCIQSVHGFVLEGRFLRASFGTAKYCHAWLKNMNCTNPACLYLHCIGAEEDTFGKEEVAAMHTRNRVQQVAGNPHNLQRRSGSVLPHAVDEPYNSYSNSTSTERIMLKSALKDPAVTGGHLAPLPSKDKDLVGRAPATSFVDIVGRVRSSCPEGDANVAEDRRILNLSSKLSSMAIDSDNPLEAEHSDAMLYNVFPSSHLVNGVHSNREFKKPVRELTAGHASLMEKKSCLMLDSAGQVQNGPYWVVGEAGLSFDNPLLKDSDSLSQMTHLFPSSYPVRISEDSSNHVWRDRESSFVNDPYSDINNVHSNADEASIQFTGLSSKSRYGCNEPKFQKSAKSDRISSNSFSDEEIMEHLRRLDDGNTTNDEPSAFGTVESSIISNILSMDFDDSNHFSSLPQKMAGVFDETDRRSGTSWNFHNSDQSGVSFRQQDGLHNQLTELASISNVGQLSRQFSVLPEGRESKEQYLFKPQHQVSRAQCLLPPGFFASSRDPPPGFSISERKDQIINATSGSHLSKPNSFPNNYHYRTPSTDISQPDFYAKPTNGMLLNKSCLDTRSLPYISQTTPYQDDSKLWHLMQPQSTSHQDPKFSQNSYIQPQIPSSYHELRYSGQIGNGLLSLPHDIYGESYNSNNHSGLAQFSQQKLSNGHNISSYYQQAAGGEIQRRERSELNKLYSSAGYGDSIFQTPSSGDVYTKLYGMM